MHDLCPDIRQVRLPVGTIARAQTQTNAITSASELSHLGKRANLSRTGFMRVELTIDGAAPGMVDIYRNGVLFDTVENNGVYRDFSRGVTETSFTYKVCQAGDVCPNDVTINF